jgi:hypothetical protein
VPGHRAALRSKGLETDYLAAVRGLIADSVLLHRNSAAGMVPAIRPTEWTGRPAIGSSDSSHDREGGQRALTAREPMSAQCLTWASLAVPTWRRSAAMRGAQDMAAIELSI